MASLLLAACRGSSLSSASKKSRFRVLQQCLSFATRATARPLAATTTSSSVPPTTTLSHRSFSNNNRKPPPIRLLRPPIRFDQEHQLVAEENSGTRPHTITMFPGDFGDDEYADTWEDDDGTGLASQEEQDETNRMIEAIKKQEQEEQAKRKRWIENAKKPIRQSIIDERGRSYGRGGRKRAKARVWIQAGFGEVVVNKRSFVDYFQRQSDREHVLEPLVATETCGGFDVQATVKGGGLTGQAGAIRLGLARALNHYNPDLYRPPLKKLGLLTRDARKVERKKVGKVKARKSPQWVRR